jgi:hypothetical protein
MIRSQQGKSFLKERSVPVAESGLRRRKAGSTGRKRLQAGLMSDPAQRHDHPHVTEQRQLLHEKGAATAELDRTRRVSGRRASDRGGDVTVVEAKAVAAIG